MAPKSQLIADIKELGILLKKLNDDVAQETSAAGIGSTATKILNAASKLKEKMRALIKLKLDGEDISDREVDTATSKMAQASDQFDAFFKKHEDAGG